MLVLNIKQPYAGSKHKAARERELEFQMCSTRGFPILWLANIRFQCHLDTSL